MSGTKPRPRKREGKPGSIDQAAELLAANYTREGSRTLQYHEGEVHEWDGRKYNRILDLNVLRSAIHLWLAGCGWPHRRTDVSEILEALRSQVTLWGHCRPPCLLRGKLPAEVAFSIAFRNTIVDFGEDGSVIQTREHSPLWFSHNALDHDWEPGARCPEWLKFLDHTFSGDGERIATLQQWCGYLLSGRNYLQRVLLLIGPPRAGKGVITRIIRAVVGPANCVNPTLTSLGDRFGLWSLIDKTVAILPDAHLGRNQDGIAVAETIKAISGGDPVDIHRKNLYTLPSVVLPVRFVIACNALPQLHDPSNALAERQSILKFDKSHVGCEDFGLESRLMKELPGITAWGLHGLKSLKLNDWRLTEPSTAAEIRADYRRLSSPVAAFLTDCCELEPGAVTPSAELYRVYKSWCANEGRNPCTNATFGSELRAAAPSIDGTKLRRDGRRVPSYSGVKLVRQSEFGE